MDVCVRVRVRVCASDGICIGLSLLSQQELASSSGASHGASHVSSSTPASQV